MNMKTSILLETIIILILASDVVMLASSASTPSSSVLTIQQATISGDELNSIKRKGPEYQTPGRFKVVDLKSTFINCIADVKDFPVLGDNGKWTYHFSTAVTCQDLPNWVNYTYRAYQIMRIGDVI